MAVTIKDLVMLNSNIARFISLVTLYYNSSMDHSPDKRYTFLKPLGQGSYGTAWLAEDTVTGKFLVFKEINKANSSVLDFRRELRYSKDVSRHPNIITTHDTAYETQSSYFLVQDYAPGGDLFNTIEPEVGLKESTAKKYLSQICTAVEFIHSNNLVHRDIKPETIVLADKEGTVVQLIDLGMAEKVGTHIPRVCGSIPYIPPEICYASDEVGFFVNTSCDVWSVGIVLFCMLTGSLPWEKATLNDPNYYQFVQWQCGTTSNPPRAWQIFSPQLLSLFNKMLAMHSENRCSITEVYKYLSDPWFLSFPSFSDNFEVYSLPLVTFCVYQFIFHSGLTYWYPLYEIYFFYNQYTGLIHHYYY